MTSATASDWRLSVAPMMAWTDRHCRVFHRLITRRTRLYTEMITTGALIHGDVPKHLDFDKEREGTVALQLGGSDPQDLAKATAIGVRWGYDEINLNCGCPSDRVQRGTFGACLMATPKLVADGVKAMLDAARGVPVTVKHRLGIDRHESYDFARDFVGTVAEAGCRVFIVHARNAWLDGLSPKDNRDVPPLRYDDARRLKRDFPDLTIVINGGIAGDDAIADHLHAAIDGVMIDGVTTGSVTIDGVMVGRAAYHDPWAMRTWDERFFGDAPRALDRDAVEAAMVDYMTQQAVHGIAWPSIARHMLGLRHGQPGARLWRRVWSDQSLRDESAATVSKLARAGIRAPTLAQPA
jgi:tRNA-dihydrouridine synthase A